MEILFLIFAFLFLAIGIIGAFLPVLPGPPFAFFSLLLLQWGIEAGFSNTFLITMGILAVVISLLDYYFPILGTRKLGGSTYGIRGSTIGLLIGLIILPALGISLGPFGLLGMILCPFIGAWVGERWSGKTADKALKAALGSFLGFLAGSFIKFVYAIITSYFVFKKSLEMLF